MGRTARSAHVKLEPVIGLEIHVQLKTKRKMFCDCPNVPDATPPNTAICSICLGHPGTLPMPNQQAIEWAARTALAIGCGIRTSSKFDRKHYFYPDLPKGYQISQYDEPIGEKGKFIIGEREIRITRLHLEEDAAKLIRVANQPVLIDFNRAGTPLIEIVTEPDFRDSLEAKQFLQELREMVRSLDVSDADMEKGQLRCDVNVSLRPVGGELAPKTEVKNVNSFRSVEHAIVYEIARQTRLWEQGKPPHATTTRGWDDDKGVTVEQRGKEGAADYRYFPEPDIPPLAFTQDWINHLTEQIGELPQAKRKRFMNEYGLKSEDARALVADSALADFTEEVFSELREWRSSLGHEDSAGDKQKLASLVSGWLLSKTLGLLAKRGQVITDVLMTPENFAEFLTLVGDRRVNTTNALKLLERMMETGSDPSNILEDEGLAQDVGVDALEPIVHRVIAANPDVVANVRKGKTAALQFLVGSVMKETKGKANPQQIMESLKRILI